MSHKVYACYGLTRDCIGEFESIEISIVDPTCWMSTEDERVPKFYGTGLPVTTWKANNGTLRPILTDVDYIMIHVSEESLGDFELRVIPIEMFLDIKKECKVKSAKGEGAITFKMRTETNS
jgi:hypothetical protein